jgi:hypothetical protein
MPTLQVAPIYADAWAKTNFEAQAVIADKPYWSYAVTLLGVTCSQYWVRFFYTEINLLRWVQDSAIVTLTDEERLLASLTDAVPATYTVGANNELKVPAAIGATFVATIYIPIPKMSNNYTLTRFSCEWAQTGAVLGASNIIGSVCMLAPNAPGVGSVVLYSFTANTPGNAYAEVSYTPATPYAFVAGNTYTFRIIMDVRANPVTIGYLWTKNFQFWIERTA